MWKRMIFGLAALTLSLLPLAAQAAPGKPRAARALVANAPVGPTLLWDYTPDGKASGFQLMRCQFVAPATTCTPSVAGATILPVASRQGSDASVGEGLGYCWAVRAVRTVGDPSTQSNPICATIPLSPLVAPTNLRLAP